MPLKIRKNPREIGCARNQMKMIVQNHPSMELESLIGAAVLK